MVDFLNKVISVILIFLMLVVAPYTNAMMSSDIQSKRMALSNATNFIDRVKDKKAIDTIDLDKLYLEVNASGGDYDVIVKRYIQVTTLDTNGVPKISYLRVDDMSELKRGDVVQVTLKDIGLSATKKMMQSFLKIEGNNNIVIAGVVT